MITTAHADHPSLSIRQLCALLGVSRSGYYDQRVTADDRTAVALRASIEDLVLVFPGNGYRRVTRQLQRDGWVVNHKRVLRVMREESLLSQLKRRFVVATDARHAGRRYPNRIADLRSDRPDQVWQADITYIRLPTTFVYLACVLDGSSRRCVGWAMSRAIDTQLALAALEMALTTRQPQPGLIHHSDQGCSTPVPPTWRAWTRLGCSAAWQAAATRTRMPRPRASSRPSRQTRCPSRSTAPIRAHASSCSTLSRRSPIANDSIRVPASDHQSSSKRIPVWQQTDFGGGPQHGVHSNG